MKRVQQFALGLAGITSMGVGAVILVAPHAFYASYGIALGRARPSRASSVM
jgi:hypothetical protein